MRSGFHSRDRVQKGLSDAERESRGYPPARSQSGQARAAEPRSAYGYRQRGPGTRVSAEQDINWGNAPAPTPGVTLEPSQDPKALWGLQPTGIGLNSEERAGMQTPFKYAGQLKLMFTKYKNCALLDVAQTNDGFSLLWWLYTKAVIRSENLKNALVTLMTDPRCAAAVQMMKDRDAKKK